MEFKFHGLENPIVLPDEYLNATEYERLQYFTLKTDVAPASAGYVRGAIAAILEDEGLVALTNELNMTKHNIKIYEELNFHLTLLLSGTGKNGDDVIDEVIQGEAEDTALVEGEPDDIPLEPSPTETPADAE